MPARVNPFRCVVMAALLLVGCTSANKAGRSSAINETGNASIENWKGGGPLRARVFVVHIDGALVQPKGQGGVYPLTPGRHELHLVGEFARMSIGDLIIDAGDIRIQFDAQTGTRYRVTARKLNRAAAEIGVQDATGGRMVVGPLNVALTDNPQHVPLPIAIPVSR